MATKVRLPHTNPAWAFDRRPVHIEERVPDELRKRFERVSHGRAVDIVIHRGALLTRDFAVAYKPRDNSYSVELTEEGCFEEAYRFVERWIVRDAAIRDGAYTAPPPDYWDCATEPTYWMLERHADQLFADLELAIARHLEFMKNDFYFMPERGGVLLETRMHALRSLLTHFSSVQEELRQGILSPLTVVVLRSAELIPSPPSAKSAVAKGAVAQP